MFYTQSLDFRTLSIQCLGSWMVFLPQVFCVKINCPPPDFPEGGYYQPEKAEYEVGEMVKYYCKTDALPSLEGTYIFCTSDGRWSGNSVFCDYPTKIKNVTASSRFFSIESTVLDGDVNTCFRTQYGPNEYLSVSVERPAVFYAIKMYIPTGSKGSFRIYVSKDKNTPALDREFCYPIDDEDIGGQSWNRIYCEDTDVKGEFITLEVDPGTSTSIAVCEFQVYTKTGEWCDRSPKRSVTNGQLEVSHSKATLICKEGYKEKDGKSVYATCKNNRWSYQSLQCTKGVCDPVISNVSPFEGEWYGGEDTNELSVGTQKTLKCHPGYYSEGGPVTVTCKTNGKWTETTANCKKEWQPPDYKTIAITVGCALVITKLFMVALAYLLKRRKKQNEVLVTVKHGETESVTVTTSVIDNSNDNNQS